MSAWTGMSAQSGMSLSEGKARHGVSAGSGKEYKWVKARHERGLRQETAVNQSKAWTWVRQGLSMVSGEV